MSQIALGLITIIASSIITALAVTFIRDEDFS